MTFMKYVFYRWLNQNLDEIMQKVEEYGQSAKLPIYYCKTDASDNFHLTIDITNIPNHKDLTMEDIIVFFAPDSPHVGSSNAGIFYRPVNYSYDSGTGIVTMSSASEFVIAGYAIHADARVMVKPDFITTAVMSGMDATRYSIKVDMTSYENFQNITRNNINIQFTNLPVTQNTTGSLQSSPVIDYDQTEGIVYIGLTSVGTFSNNSNQTVLKNGIGNIVVGVKL